MNRLLPLAILLTLTAAPAARAEELMRKVELIREDVGHVEKASKLPNGGTARTWEEWEQLKPMLSDLGQYQVNFEKETVLYCAMPEAFDGGSYPIRAETLVLDHGVLRVTCKAEWPEIFMEKTNTRRYHVVTVPKFDGPIEITFAVIGPEFIQFAPLFSSITVLPREDYPVFGPAGEASQP